MLEVRRPADGEDRDVGIELADAPDQRHAVRDLREARVEHDDLRPVGTGEGDRRVDVPGRADDVEPVPDAQDPGHALARPVVGVDDEDAEGARHAEVVGGVVGLVGG